MTIHDFILKGFYRAEAYTRDAEFGQFAQFLSRLVTDLPHQSPDPAPSRAPSPPSTPLPTTQIPSEDASPSLRNPRTHIQIIREVLAASKVPNRKALTIEGHAKCNAALDALSSMLGDADYLEATLQSFKLDLIGEINATAVRSPALSYATAAASPPAPLPAAPPAKSPPTVKLNEFTLSLDKAADVLALSQTEIKAKVVDAIAATGIEKLRGAVVKGVKALPRGRLLVATDTEKSATLLKQSSAHWAPRITKDCHLIVRRCEIVVNGVPRSFNPASPQAAQELYAHNRSAISDPSATTSMRWLNARYLAVQGYLR